MKKIKYIFIFSALFAGFTACEEDSDELTGNANTGGLVQVNTPLVGYVVGNGQTKNYEGSFTVDQGAEAFTTVDIYKSFRNTKGTSSVADDVLSNEVLLKTVTLTGNKHEVKNFTFNFNELVQGLTLGGQPMTTNDANLNIGDSWTLRFASKTKNGDHFNSKSVKVSVGTRFAGNYTVTAAEYYRIGVPRPDVSGPYVGTKITIESIDASTYKVNEYFGPFSGNEFYFTIVNDVIDYPANQPDGDPQVGNGIPMITCLTAPTEMTNVKCGSSNFVTRDDINGKDKLTMSFGYLNAPGAPREFYQVLEKIVE